MKRPPGKIAVTFLAFVLATGAATRAQAPTFTVLHSFTGSPDGAAPFAGLLRDTAGNLYGTTVGGGSLGHGTVFKLDTASDESVLYSFTDFDGAGPFAGLITDAAGNLYGTTRDGGNFGNGIVFKLDTSGKETVLHTFACADGAGPYAGLAIDAAGNLYGVTGAALACGVFGTVFKIDTSGNFAVLHYFTGSDGCCPTGGVIRDGVGNLYGTAGGGASGYGSVFKLDPSNALTVLHSFTGADGAAPAGGLIMDGSGNLYGTTSAGGSGTCGGQFAVGGCGTVFKLEPSGNETLLYSFKGGSDGANPAYGGLVMDAAGNLYGTTLEGGPGTCTGRNQVVVGCGTVFKLDPSGNETVVYTFTGGSDGAFPYAGVVMDAAGNLYGTASSFLALGGYGTVFKLAVQTPPAITSVSPTSAIAGGPAFTLTVNGTNFVSGSVVDFDGKGAPTTTFVSATQLTAAVPPSDIAIEGNFNVTVTNPSGQTSNAVTFTVVTPEDETAAIINSVNTLFTQGVVNGGQHNSLVRHLQHAIDLINAGKNNGAIGNLNAFIGEVNDLLSSGVLSPSQAALLVSAAQNVIAAL
jgi:uncharacterized repeat protein (TIGR03803 family)